MKIRPLKYTEQWHLPHGCHCSYLCRKYARECLSLKNHFSQLLRENARLKLESEKNVQGHTAGKKSEQERKNIAKHSGFVGFFDFRARKNVQSENLENLAPQSIHRTVQFLVRNPEKISYRLKSYGCKGLTYVVGFVSLFLRKFIVISIYNTYVY